MRLPTKSEFVEDYLSGYMEANSEKLQDMESEEVELAIYHCEKSAENKWEYFNKLVNNNDTDTKRSNSTGN